MNLTENQKAWIYNTMTSFTKKWLSKIPITDEERTIYIDEMKKIEKSARNEENIVKMLISFTEYFERLNRMRL